MLHAVNARGLIRDCAAPCVYDLSSQQCCCDILVSGHAACTESRIYKVLLLVALDPSPTCARLLLPSRREWKKLLRQPLYGLRLHLYEHGKKTPGNRHSKVKRFRIYTLARRPHALFHHGGIGFSESTYERSGCGCLLLWAITNGFFCSDLP